MTRKLLVALAILTLSASAASAAHQARHHRAMNANAAAPESPPPMGLMGGVSSSDHTLYLRNLHDSGYNPKGDRDSVGNVVAQ